MQDVHNMLPPLTFVACRLDRAAGPEAEASEVSRHWHFKYVGRHFAATAQRGSAGPLPQGVARKLYEVLALCAMQFSGYIYQGDEQAVSSFVCTPSPPHNGAGYSRFDSCIQACSLLCELPSDPGPCGSRDCAWGLENTDQRSIYCGGLP